MSTYDTITHLASSDSFPFVLRALLKILGLLLAFALERLGMLSFGVLFKEPSVRGTIDKPYRKTRSLRF